MLPGSQEKKMISAAKGPVVPSIKKKRKIKEPNPLSVKKSKKVKVIQEISLEKPVKKEEVEVAPITSRNSSSILKVGDEEKTNKKKRKRVKKKSKSDVIVENRVSTA